MSERQYTTKLLKALRAEPNVWCFKVHGGPMQQAGIPDIVGAWDGRFFALEVKVPSNSATSLQLHVLRDIDRRGGCGRVVYTSQSIPEVLVWLKSSVSFK